jgi:hypothetical protein
MVAVTHLLRSTCGPVCHRAVVVCGEKLARVALQRLCERQRRSPSGRCAVPLKRREPATAQASRVRHLLSREAERQTPQSEWAWRRPVPAGNWRRGGCTRHIAESTRPASSKIPQFSRGGASRAPRRSCSGGRRLGLSPGGGVSRTRSGNSHRATNRRRPRRALRAARIARALCDDATAQARCQRSAHGDVDRHVRSRQRRRGARIDAGPL